MDNNLDADLEELLGITPSGARNKKSDDGKIDPAEEFEPEEIDPSSVDSIRTKTFAFGYAGTPKTAHAYIPPADVINSFVKVAELLYGKGFTYRSGGWVYPKGNAQFKGELNKKVIECVEDNKNFEVYGAWKGSSSTAEEFTITVSPSRKAYKYAASLDTIRGECMFNARVAFRKTFSAQDVHVLLGDELDKAVGVYIIYTPDGAESIGRGVQLGGLYNNVKLCARHNIPVINIVGKSGDGSKNIIPQIKSLLNDPFLYGNGDTPL